MLSLFGFGKKKRRVQTRKSSKVRKSHKKPSATLLKACKVCGIKCTKKVGGKRVYKSSSVLKKQCLKKLRVMKKRAIKHMKKMKLKRKSIKKRRVVRRKQSFGEDDEEEESAFGRRRTRFGSYGMAAMRPMQKIPTEFGKRKVSKATAMKAFKSFYKRHCAGARRTRFGSGGNPPLGMSMGYEFCPSGMGGVLGANSTGLFPSPCTSMNMNQAAAESAITLPAYGSSSSFGMRKRSMKKRSTAVGSKRRSTAVGSKRRSTAVGAKKRSTAVGSKRRSTAVGAKKRSTAIGAMKRKLAEFGRRHKKSMKSKVSKMKMYIGTRRRV
jgi:hypothetical protein